MEEEYNLIKMKQHHNLSKTKDVINPMILMGLTLLQGSPWEGLAMEVRVHPNLHLATASAQVLSGSGEIVDIKLCWPGFLRDGVSSLLRFPTINNIPDTSTWFNGLLALKL